ncbi:Sugar transferase involved in LPS biosynthesis (colanic, teichoic acid) [Meinhardsimonia xiamenensis]|jgi:lipopolysaccharide/colanic/teichoic acid biosynthesis glycosyltransferase|uniref:Sugar transferase involved in LPS biosynthesis (Colanic, teichoic acid) n=1 Tax=Meinhardsimonia xiamenensis TaxID=990712 RepID=A0A1G9F5Q4_9RHOB|nr:sugar transferase [Meinhardsimonia xiamenensis]PRX37982.1 lipopolysaccharide/colanic/teichoic acid biosynthesis glycosyltransferase [Meinhardsimonia xiamenensis]SDK83681.1 Sugar transferase involved in LPS biosynthesis (colanic, teichoic acid) [Meinhardsimonia xiamenensis]
MSDETVNAALQLAVGDAVPDRGGAASGSALHGFYARHGKRLFDILGAAVLLAAFLPLLAILVIVIRCDGGPAFYAQTRVGRGGRRFRCLKLRTMVPGAEGVLADLCARDPRLRLEWERFQKLSDDPRITRLGRFLRKTSIDEIPQLINVLRGDMSLVGARPFTPGQEAAYRRAGGRSYFLHRPGLTGPWQVSERARGVFASRVAHDEHYLATISLGKDLQLLLCTVGAVLRGTGQ